MAQYKVAIDAGHGGSDPGAVYNGRQEKDDVLRLAMAVGKILENSGVDVFYVRNDDTYETPFKKATDANNSGADLFVSLHRNSSEIPNQYSGVESLVYADGGTRSLLADNINSELSAIGFNNLGIDERPNLVVLKRTKMPAVLVETGFINSDTDNRIFDDNFNKISSLSMVSFFRYSIFMFTFFVYSIFFHERALLLEIHYLLPSLSYLKQNLPPLYKFHIYFYLYYYSQLIYYQILILFLFSFLDF